MVVLQSHRVIEAPVRRLGRRMDRHSLSILIRDTLATYQYEPPPPDSTIGVPWTAERVYGYVEKLRDALVEPYLQRFDLRETYAQVGQSEPTYADFWVVAQGDGGYLEWYDPATGEFGLGIQNGTEVPVSIGVRGDLVGVFCAM
jgi:hypothetical protein